MPDPRDGLVAARRILEAEGHVARMAAVLDAGPDRSRAIVAYPRRRQAARAG
jgi:hypothetical protein